MSTTQLEPDLDNFLKKSFLNLEKIDVNIFRSTFLWHPVYSRSVFGGQLIGQALVAAANTVPDTQFAHSLHCYFLHRGSGDHPILYHVDRTRDGNTYCSRTVKAIQQGRVVLTMQTSFKRDERDPYTFQSTMPHVKQPDQLLNTEELIKIALETDSVKLSPKVREFLGKYLHEQIPMEMKPVNVETFIRGNKPQRPYRAFWVRARGHIGEDMNMHKCAAAYMSDLMLLDVSLLAATRGMEFSQTSLDHSIWFHNPFHANEWMLYEMESPQCGNGRALAQGRLWRSDGVLAMSVSQEGVVRTLNNPKVSKL